jgi:pimeloyl-ACP methyl ester carboxylesterase/protein-S-isoprenylcysteine O-methyltransferase Ste14
VAASPLARALLAFLVLPGVVAFAIPLVWVWPPAFGDFRLIGLIPLLPGLALLLWCVREFYVTGKGTLAPWDPPRNLVVRGPYQRSRNPMYLAVVLILFGWAIGFGSRGLFFYALAMLAVFDLRIRLFEEPFLARTFRVGWDRYRTGVPRWVFPSRRAVWLTAALLLIALPLGGLTYEAYRDGQTRREFPPPGMFVDIGGQQLHLLCIGEGSPIVLFEASGFGVSSMSAATVRERVSARTRVCSYDRIGMGWSDPAPSVLSVGELARQLAVLQDRAGLPAPFVLVASSVGGLTAEMFARQYPERAAGLIFLDAANSAMLKDLVPLVGRARAGAAILGGVAQLGVIRLLDPFDLSGDADDVRRSRGFTYGGRAMGALAAIVRGAPESLREFEQAPPLRGDVPLVVLSASDPRLLATDIPVLQQMTVARSEIRLRGHKAFAATSTRGTWKTVPKSEHLIAVSNPDVVIDAIFAMLDELR